MIIPGLGHTPRGVGIAHCALMNVVCKHIVGGRQAYVHPMVVFVVLCFMVVLVIAPAPVGNRGVGVWGHRTLVQPHS